LPDDGQQLTEDRLLDGRVRLLQPAKGYRVGVDAVLLAAAVPARPGETVLDVGTGVGAAAVCLAARVADTAVTGLDADRAMVRLATANAEANGVSRRVRFFTGDLTTPPIRLAPASFDHVMANPPYMAQGTVRQSPHPVKAAATVESTADLDDWVRFCALMVRHKGVVTMIHRADRLVHVLEAFSARLGGVVVFPLWPGGQEGNKPAKRVIVSGVKGSAAPPRLMPGLTLHRADGAFTPEADAVIRSARGLRG
jgi:tRNA1(Val) A37 N6-methylase TrmN6